MSAQRLVASIYKHLRRLKKFKPGEIVTQGLDGGNEFSFLVQGRDGCELLVLVIEEKKPVVQANHRLSQIERIVTEKQQKYIDAQERRRKRFLGEI